MVASAVGVAASTVAHVTRHVVVVVEVAGMNPLRLYCGTAVEGPRGKAGGMACAAPPGLSPGSRTPSAPCAVAFSQPGVGIVHGCGPTLCTDRSGLIVGIQWAGG